MTRNPDPSKVKVQMNVPITWEFREHLDNVSRARRISKSELIRMALEKEYPLNPDVRAFTREAGATS